MTKHGKKYADAGKRFDREQLHDPAEAIDLVKTLAPAKFDETVEAAFRLGVDPRKADQMLRGTVSLHGALDTPAPGESRVKGAVLVLHGVQDPSVPRDQVNGFIDEMSALKVDWQLVNYGQAGHSFTDPDANHPGFFYHRQTAERAAVALQAFFGEVLA